MAIRASNNPEPEPQQLSGTSISPWSNLLHRWARPSHLVRAIKRYARGLSPDAIRKVYGLNGAMREEHWLAPAPIDQRTLYEGNSVLRGGQTPRIEEPGLRVDELRRQAR